MNRMCRMSSYVTTAATLLTIFALLRPANCYGGCFLSLTVVATYGHRMGAPPLSNTTLPSSAILVRFHTALCVVSDRSPPAPLG
jgi:hypothetical protein